MKLHLVDTINKRDNIFEINCNQGYYKIWKEIDKIIDEFKYSIVGYTIPKIDKEKRIIIVHWIELFGTLSTPYLEILECTDKTLQEFDYQIKRHLKIEDSKRKIKRHIKIKDSKRKY